MKKISFLSKLKREGKLQLVSPSETIKDSYLKKSESNLASAKILLENERLEESVSLAYFSMYNMLTAILFQVGIKCENHSASIILLSALFGIDNESISSAKDERIDKQYYVDFSVTREDTVELIETAEDFNKNLFDFSSKMNSQKIKDYRKRFLELV
ncbi:MAG: HEPN domain-containing protein [Candidatus Bathyarchaeia archaeon]|jgi:uncharacterized protein (UPF0332 family)